MIGVVTEVTNCFNLNVILLLSVLLAVKAATVLAIGVALQVLVQCQVKRHDAA